MEIKFSNYFQYWSITAKEKIFINKLIKNKQTIRLELRVGFATEVRQCFDIQIVFGKKLKLIRKTINKQKILYQNSDEYRQYRLIFSRIYGV